MESLSDHDNFHNVEMAIGQYRGIIYRCITKVLKDFPEFYDPATVDDIFQDVCVLLMTKLEKYNPARGMKLGSFIGMIATHETYDFLQRQRRKSHYGQHVDINRLSEMANPHGSPEEFVLGKDLEKNILAAREQLSFCLRRAFDLEMMDGISDAKDLADAMKVNKKTIYSRRAKLREALASALPEEWRGDLERKKAA